MKKVSYSIMMAVLGLFSSFNKSNKNYNYSELKEGYNSGFYTLKAETLQGDSIEMSKFKGKKILIVNTASKCGFTPQYKDLQELHEKYKDKLVILGFPCNQFGNQEPGSKAEIKEFCSINYGVTFQMMQKVNVKDENVHPIYQWLTTKSQNGWNEKSPNWNFCKYLIDEEGKLVEFWGSGVKPTSKQVVDAILK